MAERMTEREQFYYGKGYNKAIEDAADLARKPNKMEVVAALFGKRIGERFTVERDNDRFDCEFSTCGFMVHGAYENPYMDFNCFILEDVLTGRAVIVNDK